MDDPLSIIYEKNMLRNIGAAVTLATSPLMAKDGVDDYKKAANQTAQYIKTFDQQLQFTKNPEQRKLLEKDKFSQLQRLKQLVAKLKEMGVSDLEIRNLDK